MGTFDEKEIKIDQIKLRKMQYKIYELEKRNYKTRQFTRPEMVENVRKIIIEEHRKNI